MAGYNHYDFSYEFDTDLVDSEDRPVHIPKRGTPINAYKQFKAINRRGDTYYMSGVRRGY